MMDGHDTVGRQDADRADAVGAILQQDSEIILVGGAARARLQPAQPAFRAAKIGRASCRERVCQYGSISVVAVSLKKNKYDRPVHHAKPTAKERICHTK